MSESLRTRWLHWRFNWFPAYRGTGGRVTHIASDFRYGTPGGRGEHGGG